VGATVVAVDRALDDAGIGDDELAALALAADPDQPVGPDALPISLTTPAMAGQLPEWYMPAPMSTVRGKARRVLLGGLVAILVVINGAGLCVTYGVPEIAW
jgi:alpha-D-ribose 1-methylphosphonate 5-triphosphate synthase subunit PhnI